MRIFCLYPYHQSSRDPTWYRYSRRGGTRYGTGLRMILFWHLKDIKRLFPSVSVVRSHVWPRILGRGRPIQAQFCRWRIRQPRKTMSLTYSRETGCVVKFVKVSRTPFLAAMYAVVKSNEEGKNRKWGSIVRRSALRSLLLRWPSLETRRNRKFTLPDQL